MLPSTDLVGAVHVAEAIRRAVEGLRIAHRASDVSKYVTISAGVACVVPSGDGSAHQLLSGADTQLYRAKRAGRNRTCHQQKAAAESALEPDTP